MGHYFSLFSQKNLYLCASLNYFTIYHVISIHNLMEDKFSKKKEVIQVDIYQKKHVVENMLFFLN